MPEEVYMPKLGLTMTEGTILRWLKAEGELVEKGQPLFEFETEKTTLELEAPVSGVLSQILAPAGTTVPVGQVIAFIVPAGEGTWPTTPIQAGQQAGEPDLALKTGVGAEPAQYDTGQEVAHRAAETLPSAPPPTPVEAAGEVLGMSGVRAVIARRMAESAHTTASVTTTTQADATELVRLQAELTEEWQSSLGFAPSYHDLLMVIVAKALSEYPYMNAHLVGENIHRLAAINIGLAVDTERGLLVPVIKGVENMTLADVARVSRDLVERARAGTLLPDDLTGGTFTLTNMGMFEVDAFTPIINLPECAILGVGRIAARPAVVDGQICIRQMVTLSLTFDHRAVDGAPAARFLQRVKQLVEQPDLALLRSR